jgi:hypothetical protein
MRHWEFRGTMDWYDEWDFDEHDATQTSRTSTGVTRTAIGHNVLIGRPFRVGSQSVVAAQTNSAADFHDILDKHARVLATFDFLGPGLPTRLLWKSMNRV